MSIIMELFKRSQEKSKDLSDQDFWEIIDCIDHEYSGDSEAVISSIIRHLKNCEDDYIFAFDDKLSELIYALDGKKWADELFGNEPFSEDKFLSARCAAVASGMSNYSKIIGHREKLSSENIHHNNGKWYCATDGLILSAAAAWSKKHLESIDKYTHKPKCSLKAKSNTEMWK